MNKTKVSKIDFKVYQDKAAKTDQFNDKERSLASSFWNLHETVGSLSRLYDERDRVKNVNPDKFKELCSRRLGDALWYISNISGCLDLDMEEIATANLKRAEERWGTKTRTIGLFDKGYPEDEQLPRKITFKVQETKEGVARLAMQMANGRWHQLGARVTDNSHIDDGYRYHDILHVAYMGILGWSPVMRALMNCKRKSKPKVDEVEDGARAINLEEALTALVYEHARSVNYFENEDYVPFEVLRWVEKVSRGLEVNKITYDLWNKAILDGYNVWRQTFANKGGYIDIDLNKREITYRKVEKKK